MSGKSSLLNALTGRKALARVSHQPGRTRQLNFFQLEAAPIVLVDMPGYGYAEAPKAIKRDWQGLMLDYLRGPARNLRRVLLLLDARVEVKNLRPKPFWSCSIYPAVAYQIVLTKADAVKPVALAKKQAEIRALAASHPAAMNAIITHQQTQPGWALMSFALILRCFQSNPKVLTMDPATMTKAAEQAHIVARALPYLRRYAGATIVVKYGGHAMAEDHLAVDFGRDIALLKQVGINPVIVHGGGAAD